MKCLRDLTPEEVFAMLHQLTPLEETRSYKIIFGRGESKGKAEGKAAENARAENGDTRKTGTAENGDRGKRGHAENGDRPPLIRQAK
jgi:predicted transposase YdaD